jgi:hypothetical protein
MMRFVGEHTLLRGATAPALLPAEFFDAGTLGIGAVFPACFNLIQQQFASEKPIQALLARGLTLDLQSGRSMQQHYAGRSLVYVLATVTTRADKGLFNLEFAHAECSHSLRELIFPFEADGE